MFQGTMKQVFKRGAKKGVVVADIVLLLLKLRFILNYYSEQKVIFISYVQCGILRLLRECANTLNLGW